VGIKTCSVEDSLILLTFLAFSALMVVYEVKRVQREQNLKLSVDKKLPEGELRLTRGKLIKLLIGSIVGGMVGAMGLGGGVVFNPVLLSLGVPPTVVAATGMYLIMYS